MNIFVTNKCPVLSAKFIDNKRKIKMALESTQMLATALNLNGIETPYRNAHPNHPCTIWARTSRQNWLWLWEHGVALCHEYHRIYGKQHACLSVLAEMKGKEAILPDIGLTPFANCTRSKKQGIDFTSIEDTITAYQLYLNARWDNDIREPVWT